MAARAGREAHRVDREAEEHDVGAPLGDQLLDRLLVDVVLELLLVDRDGDDLVDALDVDLVGECGGILARPTRDRESGPPSSSAAV